MADAEVPLWDVCLAEDPPLALAAPVHLLKVAHHGSVNGYHQQLYGAVADPGITIGVVTPFRNGDVSLPVAAGVEAIRPHVKDLYCTNRGEAVASTSLGWEPVVIARPPTLPLRWVHMIEQRHELGTLLVSPPHDLPVLRSAAPRLPRAWVDDLRNEPTLFQLLRPDLRPAVPSPPRVEEHRLSVYFDERGNLLDVQAGLGVGRLTT